MKYLIVGLGNPGTEYENTRHNIGFKVLDSLIKGSGISFSDNRHAFVAYHKFKGRTLVLAKPTTFMNLSGKAVNYWLQKERIELQNLLIVTDDLALPFGIVRLRAKGSDGGHNGLKDINTVLKTTKYARLRVGIGNEFHPGGQVDFVLSEWMEEEHDALLERVELAVKMIHGFCTTGVARTMSDLNNK